MNAITHESARFQENDEIPQFSLSKIIWMFAWPALWYTLLIYGGRMILFPGGASVPTWFQLLVFILGGGAELIVALILLKREWLPLRDRLRLRFPRNWKAWILAAVVLLVGMSLSMMMGSVNRGLASLPGFVPPTWWPAASNPTVEIKGVADVFPDVELAGNYQFVLLYFAIGLLFNVFGEETYYRGYLLPHMQGTFGKGDWIANGVLFTVKHVYQRWLYPGILVGGLCFAFAAGPLNSLPLAMVYHWVGNYMFQMVFLIQGAFGGG